MITILVPSTSATPALEASSKAAGPTQSGREGGSLLALTRAQAARTALTGAGLLFATTE